MPSVRVRVPAAEFSGAMRAIAEWLDATGYEPTRYKYTHGQNAVFVTIDFPSAVGGESVCGLAASANYLRNSHRRAASASRRYRAVTIDKRQPCPRPESARFQLVTAFPLSSRQRI